MKQTLFTFSVLLISATLQAQFLTPDFRNGFADENFAYWLGFQVPYTPEDAPYEGLDDTEVNYTFAGGNEVARLGQYASSSAIITSTSRLYSYGGDDPLGIRVYDNPDYSPGTILLQAMTYQGSQSTPLTDSVKLFYRTADGGDWIEYSESYTNTLSTTDATSNHFISWEWDTSSLLIYDYYIQFDYELIHSSFAAAQLDTNETYETQFDGLGLNINTNVYFGQLYGIITKTPEKVVYEPFETVRIEAITNESFEFVKWVGDFGESTENPLDVTVTGADITLIVATTNYRAWRQQAFPSNHGGGITTSDWASSNDYDGDGMTNAMEYMVGGQPENPVLEEYYHIETVTVQGEDYPAIVFRQQCAAEDLSYQIAVSYDLDNWLTNDSPGGPYTSDPEIINLNDDGTKVVRVRSLTPLNAETPTPFLNLNAVLTEN